MTWDSYWVDDELWSWMESISKAIEQKLKNEKEDDIMPLRYKKEIGMHIIKESIPEISQELAENNITSFMWDIGEEKLIVSHNGVQKCFDFGERIHITPNKIFDTGTVFYDVYLAWDSKDGEVFEKLQSAQNVKEFHLTNGLGYSTGMLEVKTKCDDWYEALFNNAIVIFDDDGEFVEILDVETYGCKTHTILRENGYKRVELL